MKLIRLSQGPSGAPERLRRTAGKLLPSRWPLRPALQKFHGP